MSLVDQIRAAIASALVTFGAQAAPLPKYYLYQVAEGNPITSITGINEEGRISGYRRLPNGQYEAFVTGATGRGVTYLGTLGGVGSYAFDVNAHGQVAGYIVQTNGQAAAFVTDANNSNMHLISVPGTATGAFALKVNDAGQVLGFYNEKPAGSSFSKPTFFLQDSRSEIRTDLFFPGIASPQITALNSRGQIAGYGVFEDDEAQLRQAFLTSKDGAAIIRIGSLAANGSFATGINDNGEVTGYALGLGDAANPLITDAEGSNPRLKETLGGDIGLGYSITSAGHVGGRSTTGSDNHTARAYISRHQGRLYDLNGLVKNLPADVKLTTVVDSNERGQLAVMTDDGRSYIACPTKTCQ